MHKRFDARRPRPKAVRSVRMPANSLPSYELACWLCSQGNQRAQSVLVRHATPVQSEVLPCSAINDIRTASLHGAIGHHTCILKHPFLFAARQPLSIAREHHGFFAVS